MVVWKQSIYISNKSRVKSFHSEENVTLSYLIDPPLFVSSGVQERDVRCVLTSDSSVVSDKACDLLTKPPSFQECHMLACAPTYVRISLNDLSS